MTKDKLKELEDYKEWLNSVSIFTNHDEIAVGKKLDALEKEFKNG